MRQTAITILAGLLLSACATGSANAPTPTKLSCDLWPRLLADGTIKRGMDRSAVNRTYTQLFISLSYRSFSQSSVQPLSGCGPVDRKWDCLIDDYKCDRGEFTPGTVLLVYKLKERASTGAGEPSDVPGHVWVLDYWSFQQPGDVFPPLPPLDSVP